MTTTRTSHTGHDHANTPAARAACRRGTLPVESVQLDEAMLDQMRSYRDRPTRRSDDELARMVEADAAMEAQMDIDCPQD